MKFLIKFLSVSVLAIFCASIAIASPVSWTDWTSTSTTASGVFGSLTVDSSTVEVTYLGPYAFAQTSGGTNYWTEGSPAPYTGSTDVDNAPPASDIIALSTGGSKTITFSEAVLDPMLALVSWNGNTVDFGVPIEILSYGAGAYGNGIPVLNPGETGFYGNGEVHGVIRLPGSYTSITFTDTSENWHGFTVGVAGLAPSSVPEPATMLLLGSGLIGLVGFRRKFKN